jgi:MipA family protein
MRWVINKLAFAMPLSGFASGAFAADLPLGSDLATSSGDKDAPPVTGSYSGLTKAEGDEVPPQAQGNDNPSLPEAAPRKWQRNYFSIGAGIGTVPSYTGSDKNILIPAVVVRGRINGISFTSRGVNLATDIVREQRGAKVDVRFGPQINYRTERSVQIGDIQVAALGKLKRTLEAGASLGISKTGVITSKHDQIGARVSVLTDVMGRHKGLIISPTIEYGTPLSKRTYVGLSASTSIVSKSFGRYYYDITPRGSTLSGLPTYSDAGRKAGVTKYSIGLVGAQSLSGDLRKGWTVVAGVQYGKVVGRYADSPIVRSAGRAKQWHGGIGLAYTFA